MITITKVFGPYPAAHRQPKHDGHCSLVHGHNWSFTITFGVDSEKQLDGNGFVLDFGKMSAVKAFLKDAFDHTFLVHREDPQLTLWNTLNDLGLCKLIVLDNPPSAEFLAQYVAAWFKANWTQIFPGVPQEHLDKISLVSVKCSEDEINSATYHLP